MRHPLVPIVPICSDRETGTKPPLCSGCSDLFRSNTGTGAFHGVPMFRGVYPRNAGTEPTEHPLVPVPIGTNRPPLVPIRPIRPEQTTHKENQ